MSTLSQEFDVGNPKTELDLKTNSVVFPPQIMTEDNSCSFSHNK